jgi:hypothetical protein
LQKRSYIFKLMSLKYEFTFFTRYTHNNKLIKYKVKLWNRILWKKKKWKSLNFDNLALDVSCVRYFRQYNVTILISCIIFSLWRKYFIVIFILLFFFTINKIITCDIIKKYSQRLTFTKTVYCIFFPII